jgi:hypothetical protein
MTSAINPNNIDGNYPVAGQDNSSQGMRDNFTNIKVNFQSAAAEITDIQNKGIFKSALTGATLDNNMSDALLYAAQIRDFSGTTVDVAGTSGSILINYVQGHYQYITTSGSITLSFANFPPLDQYGYIKLQINITNTAHTVTLPAAVTLGTSGLQGYSAGTITFSQTGIYEFGFGTYDSGATITIFDLNRALTNFSGADLVIDDVTASGNITATGVGSVISSAGNIVSASNVTAGATVAANNVTATSSVSAVGNVAGGNVIATTAFSTTGTVFATTVQGYIRPTSGTGSQPPVQFAAGSTLSSPAAGAWEYDGQSFFATPLTSQRGTMALMHFVVLNSSYVGTDSSSAQQVFDTPAAGTVTLAANTAYMFDAQYLISRSAGTTSHTLSTLFATTGTLLGIAYTAETTSSSGNSLTAVKRIYSNAVTATVVTDASTAADEFVTVTLRGVIRTNTAVTLQPQIQYSATPGGAPTILANSYFRLMPIGNGTVTTVGNWS